MPNHPSGNPDLIHQHKVIQRQGDQERNGAEVKGKDSPGLEEKDIPEERTAGVVKPNGGQAHLPAMKPATKPEIDSEAGGEGATGAGGNPGP
jgi:hypothetical protein